MGKKKDEKEKKVMLDEENEYEEISENDEEDGYDKGYTESELNKAIEDLGGIKTEQQDDLFKSFEDDKDYQEMVDATEFFKSFDEKHREIQKSMNDKINDIGEKIAVIANAVSIGLKQNKSLGKSLGGVVESLKGDVAKVKEEIKVIGEEPEKPKSIQSSAMAKGFVSRDENEGKRTYNDYLNDVFVLQQRGHGTIDGEPIDIVTAKLEIMKSIDQPLAKAIDDMMRQ